jgi:hypothetical protein
VRKALTAALGGWPHIAWVLLPERAGQWQADGTRETMEAS